MLACWISSINSPTFVEPSADDGLSILHLDALVNVQIQEGEECGIALDAIVLL